jgi:hypothetical protein
MCERQAPEMSIAIKEIKIGQLFLFLWAPKIERGRHLSMLQDRAHYFKTCSPIFNFVGVYGLLSGLASTLFKK